jgi:twinkle protein
VLGRRRRGTILKFIKHCACEACGSSDGKALYEGGTSYCFVCQTWNREGDEEGNALLVTAASKKDKWMMIEQPGDVTGIQERGIHRSTTQFYGVTCDSSHHYYPYHSADGVLTAYKRRLVEDKTFSIKGNFKDATLFGQSKFHSTGKYVTVTEGEIDAMSVFQMTGSKWPVVSLRNGAQAALKDCKEQYEWLNGYENIVICFDEDEPGVKAARQVAELFGAKAKIVKHIKGFKDANEYLTKGRQADFTDAWWKAEVYTPDGIINGVDLWDEINTPIQKPDASWPYPELDKMLCGLRVRELVTIAAGTGQGKSTFLRQLIHHLLMTTSDNVGMAFLEESPKRTALGIMSIEAKKPLHRPDTMYTESEFKKAYDLTIGSGRCVMFNHFGSLDIDNVLNRLKYMAKVQECKWIILDHYQMILSGLDMDERKGLDMLLTRLRTFVEETGVGLFGVSHTRRQEGKGLENGAEISLSSLRGTQGISQLSDAVVGLQRDQQADDEVVRNTTEVRLLKSRFTGETGPAGYLYFDKATNRLVATEKPEPLTEPL